MASEAFPLPLAVRKQQAVSLEYDLAPPRNAALMLDAKKC